MKRSMFPTRSRVLLALVGVILLLGAPALAAPRPADPRPAEVQISAADAGRRIELTGSQVLAISLPGNPSTGYNWEPVDLDETILQPAGEIEFQPQSSLLGAPGALTLRFQTVRAGQTTLTLAYRRPWEKDVTPLDTFSVVVQSEGAYTGDRRPVQAPPTGPLPAPDDALALDVPSAFNWCSQGGCTSVKNQGNCGSCWAFGTVGVLESNIKIHDGVEKNLAEQYLLSCNTDGWSCDGGWWAHKYHLNAIPPGEPAAGAVYESDFPYVAAGTPCNPPHTHHEKITSWAYVGNSYSVPSVSAIKQAIYDHGPVAAAIYVGSDFQRYTGGIFQSTQNGTVNHAIILVGWDDSQGFWILRNSWGAGWGEGGYMRIKYGTSSVGYAATYVVYGGGAAAPAAPTNLAATAASQTQINLSWTDNSNNETGFKIERSPNGSSSWTQIATVGANVTTYANTGLTCGTPYYYRVRATNASGDSAYSNTATATTAACGSCADAYEPDGAYTSARSLTVSGAAQAHNFHAAGDEDWGKFTAVAGRSYRIATSNLGDSNDTVLYLYDTTGVNILREDDDAGEGLASQIVWTAPASGVYYVRVRQYWGDGGCSGYGYDLTVGELRRAYLPLIVRR